MLVEEVQQSPLNKRGLASADQDTRERVAKAGGVAIHLKRGLQASNDETRSAVARKGGLARGEQRRRIKLEREAIQNPT